MKSNSRASATLLWRSIGSICQETKAFAGEVDGGGAILAMKLREQVLDVFAHRLGSNAEDARDIGIAFAASDPGEHFALTRGESHSEQRSKTFEASMREIGAE
jgi:hypothetical protein